MNAKVVKGYVLIVVSGLVILAAAALVVVQWTNEGTFSFFGHDMKVRMWLLLLGAAGGGMVIRTLLRLLVRGIGSLKRGWQAAGAKGSPERFS